MTGPSDGELTGEVIAGRYVVGTLLGTGGMADVYRAYDRQMSRAVAVKVFDGCALPEDSLRLEREARMLSSLRCQGIVTVFDVGTVARRPYYVMQEITGGTLRQRMRDPLPPAFVARVGGQIASVLAHVHEMGVVHRDIKPSNILLDDTARQAYLADFGLALQAHVTRVTRSGVLVGTAGYLAPEQVSGSTVGPSADVYALGLVLLECLTGRPEYPGGDAEAALSRLSRTPRVPALLPAEWISLLTAMTHISPTRRPSARQCADSLQAAQEASKGLPALIVPEDFPVVEVPRQRSRRFGYAVSAAAAAAVAAVAVLVSNLGGGAAPATGEPVPPSTDPPSVAPAAPPSTVSVIVPPQTVTQEMPPVVVTPETITVTKPKPSRDPRPDRTRHPKRSKDWPGIGP